MDRYGGAVRRYLLGALRDADAADDVLQEFALKLVSGAFQRAAAGQGRFRNFLKTSLFHLIVDHQRRRLRQGVERPLVSDPPIALFRPATRQNEEEAWTRSWREELLAKSWHSLSEAEQSSGTPYYAVLRFRCDHPDMHSPEMAVELGRTLGKPLHAPRGAGPDPSCAGNVGRALLDLVRDSLDDASTEELERELIDLSLLDYCREELRRRHLPSGVTETGGTVAHGEHPGFWASAPHILRHFAGTTGTIPKAPRGKRRWPDRLHATLCSAKQTSMPWRRQRSPHAGRNGAGPRVPRRPPETGRRVIVPRPPGAVAARC